jgi:tetratricopeptide (TPR) repeat protein
MVRWFVWLLGLSLLVSLPSCKHRGSSPRPVMADDDLEPAKNKSSKDEANARKHMETGAELRDSGRCLEALPEFEAAYRLAGQPAALLAVAQCRRELRRIPQAYEAYEQVLVAHGSQLTAEERAAAQKALNELGATTGTLLLVVSTRDADLEVDGRKLGRSPMPKARRVRAGALITVRVTKAGFVPYEQGIVVAAGESKNLEIRLGPPASTPSSTTSTSSSNLSEAERKAAARAAFTEGMQLQQDGKCEEALERFQAAQRLYDALSHQLHIAQCQAATGKLVEAQETYETIVHAQLSASAPPAFQKAQETAKKEVITLRPRVPTLRIQVTPKEAPNLVVSVNGSRVPNEVLNIARPMNPGTYKVTATATGMKASPVDVEIQEGEIKAVDVKLTR